MKKSQAKSTDEWAVNWRRRWRESTTILIFAVICFPLSLSGDIFKAHWDTTKHYTVSTCLQSLKGRESNPFGLPHLFDVWCFWTFDDLSVLSLFSHLWDHLPSEYLCFCCFCRCLFSLSSLMQWYIWISRSKDFHCSVIFYFYVTQSGLTSFTSIHVFIHFKDP